MSRKKKDLFWCQEFYDSLQLGQRDKYIICRYDLPKGIYEYAKNLVEPDSGDFGITILPLTPEGEQQRLEEINLCSGFGYKDYNFYYNGELFNLMLTYHD
jgi:hypothetical protein